MRLVSIITAILVTVSLYLFVFQRDRVMEFAYSFGGASGQAPQATEKPATPAADNTSVASQANTSEGTPIVSVVAMHSVARNVTSAVLVRGQTEAARQVVVRSETSGQVISEPLRKGAEVSKGDVLCRLDPGTREVNLQDALARLAEAKARVPEAEARLPEAEARLAEARARLREAELNLKAAQSLSKEGYASETRVASAKAAFESASAAVQTAKSGLASAESGVKAALAGVQSAEAGVAAARREIERLTIRAPFSGLLESDAAELGTLLQPGAQCATVIQLDPVKLVGFVPELDVDKIHIGSRAGARLADGRQVAGQVSFIGRSADPVTRTFRVEVQIPNTDLSIRDGQTAEIVIASDGQKAHLLPQSALTLDDDGRLGVRTVASESRAHFVPVEVVRDQSDGIWVTGLPDEADVIVVGQDYAADGVEVKVAMKDSAQ